MEIFLLGLVAGAAVSALFVKRDDIKKAFQSPEFQSNVERGKKQAKQAIDEVKDKAKELLDNISSEQAP